MDRPRWTKTLLDWCLSNGYVYRPRRRWQGEGQWKNDDEWVLVEAMPEGKGWAWFCSVRCADGVIRSGGSKSPEGLLDLLVMATTFPPGE